MGVLKYNGKPVSEFTKEYLEDENNKMVAVGIRNEAFFASLTENKRIHGKLQKERTEAEAEMREKSSSRRKRRSKETHEISESDDKEERAQ